MSQKKIYVRYGIGDIVLPLEDVEKFNGCISVIDEDGKEIATPLSYLIGCEDENGNECDEDGKPL